MGKREKETIRILGGQTKIEERRKIAKIKSTDPAEKIENWLKKIFFGILYYRSEKKYLVKNYPKVKLPRSRHK